VDPVDVVMDGAVNTVGNRKGSGKGGKKMVSEFGESMAKQLPGAFAKDLLKSVPTQVAPKAMTMEFDDPMPSSSGRSEYTIPDAG
jgi:hypothetical protein